MNYCKICVKEIPNNRKFCSQKCMGIGFTRVAERTCPSCHKKFIIVGTHANPARYCSDECRASVKKHYGYHSQLILPKEEWKFAYLAGLIDGEGSIKKDRTGSSNILQIVNTDPNVIAWIQKTFGGSVLLDRRQKKPHHKQLYRWSNSVMIDVIKILRFVKPYLIIKRKKAEDMILDIQVRLEKHYLVDEISAEEMKPEVVK